jgi:hypothetical protein
MKDEESITWERDHPITFSLIQHLGRDLVRMSKPQMENIQRIVGKLEIDLKESRDAQVKLRNHIIWHIEKNNQNPAYSK